MPLSFTNLHFTPMRDLGNGGKSLQAEITQLSVNATGNRVINTRTDKTIRVWKALQLGASSPSVIENAHRDIPRILWNTNTDLSFASVGRDSWVKMWTCSGRLEREIKVLKPHGTAVLELVEYSTDGKVLCVVDIDGTVILYDVADNYSKLALIKLVDHVNDIQWTNRGHDYLFAALDNGTVEILHPIMKTKTVTVVHTLEGHKSPVTCIRFDPRGRFFACGTKEGIVSLWRTSNMLNYRALSLVDQQVVDVEYSRDGSYLAVAFAQDTTIKVYDCDTLEQLYEVPNSSAGKSGFLALKWLPHRANFVYVAENGRVVEFAKRDQKIGK